MKCLLVDDHWLFLDGLSEVLHLYKPELNIIKANSVENALEILSIHPDIEFILVDLAMPKQGGLSLINTLNKNNTLIPTIVLSASENITEIHHALSAGAQGFIPKSIQADMLIEAIESVLIGNIYIPTYIEVKLTLINEINGGTTTSKQSLLEQLTVRQFEVLRLLDSGFTNQKIAEKLFISEHTVKSHLKQIFQKIGCDNRLECLKKAKEYQLI